MATQTLSRARAARAANSGLEMTLVLTGAPRPHLDTLLDLFAEHLWNVQLDASDWSGKATRGNRVLNALFGVFAQYHEVEFSFATEPDDTTLLHLKRSTSGMMGGLLGMQKAKESFRAIAGSVRDEFADQRTLVEAY